MLINCSGSKLGLEHSLGVPVLLTNSDQSINGYVMCDGIGEFPNSTTLLPLIFCSRKYALGERQAPDCFCHVSGSRAS